ncbi:cadherin-like protein 26 [Carassius auratus]|uniref:Cadherin-like protein 26 n=1 Tax=Carassius auratus TaxID=7957 RepID=A0A6P6MVK7_CARAU|nr:cadherin-like protein 26 [Carassius auratus]
MICFNMRTLPVSFLLLLSVWSVCEWADSRKIRQKRAWIIDSFSIEEEHPGPFPYILGKVSIDTFYLLNFKLQGQGVDEKPKNILSIKDTGEIIVHGKVDYEKDPKVLFLNFEAINISTHKPNTRLGLDIKILDINDNAPEFQKSVYEVTVDESHAQGKDVLTVQATDADDSETNNGTFSFTIKSVIPKTDNVEFYIQQKNQTGTIYFKGCLDSEKAQKYTVLVEAKDKGEKIQLSSTSTVIINISDNNNNLPEFFGKTGPGRVKEREAGVEVLRLQVTDRDVRGSKAWKAKYIIYGDKKEIFKIETDPVTNEGILTVVKPMDYEEQTYQNLSISVQNEIPYYSCKIQRKVPNAAWELDQIAPNSDKSVTHLYNSIPVTIYVEDVNDPPVFIPPVKHFAVTENIDVGTSLTTFTAKDMDGSYANTFTFIKGEDIDGWITVDAKTGHVSTAKILDRESPFVLDDTYTVKLYAVDEGVPPMTGTGTLVIHLIDQNDNVPILEVNTVSICQHKEPTMVNITAVDLDFPPYGSPFYYELLGDVKDKWRLEPDHGTTVGLVKEDKVSSGHHVLQIKISDQQGLYSIQNLTVKVCDCSLTPKCHGKMVSNARMGSVAIWMLVLSVLTAMCFMSLLITCKTEKDMTPVVVDGEGSSNLMNTNTERPGTDCSVIYKGQQAVSQDPPPVYSDQQFSDQQFSQSIYKKLLALQTCDDQHVIYKPHCYADEGQPMDNGELDAISIPEDDFQSEMLRNLDSKFSKLATISRPDLMRR